jgi:signal transduction histidine kinase
MTSGMLREKLAEPVNRELMSMVEAEARRGSVIVNQLLTFGRGVAGRPRTPVQPRRLIRDLGLIMRETFPRNITIIEEVAADLWMVPVVRPCVALKYLDATRAGRLTIFPEKQQPDRVDVGGLQLCLGGRFGNPA